MVGADSKLSYSCFFQNLDVAALVDLVYEHVLTQGCGAVQKVPLPPVETTFWPLS